MIHLKGDPTRWWEKDHDPRCNIEVLGAEPLIAGGDCTCGAATASGGDSRTSAEKLETGAEEARGGEGRVCSEVKKDEPTPETSADLRNYSRNEREGEK